MSLFLRCFEYASCLGVPGEEQSLECYKSKFLMFFIQFSPYCFNGSTDFSGCMFLCIPNHWLLGIGSAVHAFLIMCHHSSTKCAVGSLLNTNVAALTNAIGSAVQT